MWAGAGRQSARAPVVGAAVQAKHSTAVPQPLINHDSLGATVLLGGIPSVEVPRGHNKDRRALTAQAADRIVRLESPGRNRLRSIRESTSRRLSSHRGSTRRQSLSWMILQRCACL